MQVLYRPHERFRVMSIFGLLGGAAGILGPVLAGSSSKAIFSASAGGRF
jgi:hypothetical protein